MYQYIYFHALNLMTLSPSPKKIKNVTFRAKQILFAGYLANKK